MRGFAPSRYKKVAMMQKPVKAKKIVASPTKPVKKSQAGAA